MSKVQPEIEPRDRKLPQARKPTECKEGQKLTLTFAGAANCANELGWQTSRAARKKKCYSNINSFADVTRGDLDEIVQLRLYLQSLNFHKRNKRLSSSVLIRAVLIAKVIVNYRQA